MARRNPLTPSPFYEVVCQGPMKRFFPRHAFFFSVRVPCTLAPSLVDGDLRLHYTVLRCREDRATQECDPSARRPVIRFGTGSACRSGPVCLQQPLTAHAINSPPHRRAVHSLVLRSSWARLRFHSLHWRLVYTCGPAEARYHLLSTPAHLGAGSSYTLYAYRRLAKAQCRAHPSLPRYSVGTPRVFGRSLRPVSALVLVNVSPVLHEARFMHRTQRCSMTSSCLGRRSPLLPTSRANFRLPLPQFCSRRHFATLQVFPQRHQ